MITKDKCLYYRDKNHNIVDGFSGSCPSPKSPDHICPYSGDARKCDISVVEEEVDNNDLDFLYYRNVLMTLLGKFKSYTEADIARIFIRLALKADEKATFNLVDQEKLKYKPNSISG